MIINFKLKCISKGSYPFLEVLTQKLATHTPPFLALINSVSFIHVQNVSVKKKKEGIF